MSWLSHAVRAAAKATRSAADLLSGLEAADETLKSLLSRLLEVAVLLEAHPAAKSSEPPRHIDGPPAVAVPPTPPAPAEQMDLETSLNKSGQTL